MVAWRKNLGAAIYGHLRCDGFDGFPSGPLRIIFGHGAPPGCAENSIITTMDTEGGLESVRSIGRLINYYAL